MPQPYDEATTASRPSDGTSTAGPAEPKTRRPGRPARINRQMIVDAAS